MGILKKPKKNTRNETRENLVFTGVSQHRQNNHFFLRERKKGPQAWDPPDVIATMTISTKSKLKGYKIQGINDALFP